MVQLFRCTETVERFDLAAKELVQNEPGFSR
jgi:hypothetical protein